VRVESGNLVLVYADKPEDLEMLSVLVEVVRKRYENPKFRSLGSAALELAYTAIGRSIAFADLRGSLRNVDVAAALGMLYECGGVAMSADGKKVELELDEVRKIGTIVASLDAGLVTEFVERLSKGGSAAPAHSTSPAG